MIYILKNSNNSVYLTLREKSSLANSAITYTNEYLFNFRNAINHQDLYFKPIALSSSSRYDCFTIIESGVTFQNLTAGTINLVPNIFYEYYIYEYINTGSTSLSLTATRGEIVESGKVLVSGGTSHTNFIRYINSAETQSNISSVSSSEFQPIIKRIIYNG